MAERIKTEAGEVGKAYLPYGVCVRGRGTPLGGTFVFVLPDKVEVTVYYYGSLHNLFQRKFYELYRTLLPDILEDLHKSREKIEQLLNNMTIAERYGVLTDYHHTHVKEGNGEFILKLGGLKVKMRKDEFIVFLDELYMAVGEQRLERMEEGGWTYDK